MADTPSIAHLEMVVPAANTEMLITPLHGHTSRDGVTDIEPLSMSGDWNARSRHEGPA